MTSLCTLCIQTLKNHQINLQQTYTLSSNVLLLNFLQSCIKEEFITTNYLICRDCYSLLIELDNLKRRANEIQSQLEKYVLQHNHKEASVVPQKDPLEVHPDEAAALSILEQEDFKVENEGLVDEIKLEQDCLESRKTLDNGGPALFKCPHCAATKWKTSKEFKSHLLSHRNNKPFICEICGKGYKRQAALTIHIGMHNGVHPFTCVYCKKSFTQKISLERHIPLHTGEFPFQCDLCGKRFIHHSSFNVHQLTHTGEKSYKCTLCDLSLTSTSHLKRHMRKHTGEKRFSCETCGRKFAEKYNLAAHVKVHKKKVLEKIDGTTIIDAAGRRHRYNYNKLETNTYSLNKSKSRLEELLTSV